MEKTDKLFDFLSMYAEVLAKSVEEHDHINYELNEMRIGVQEIRSESIQLRAELQQLHNDISKIGMILTTPKSQRKEFAISVFGKDFEKLKEDDSLQLMMNKDTDIT